MIKKSVLGLALLLPAIASAQPITLESGTISASAIISASKNGQAQTTKPVTLMKVTLSPEQLQKFVMSDVNAVTMVDGLQKSSLPASVDLGMNNVPVLDQGQHGTCVTFASTAAVDAVMNKGDYVSQLCSLELGSYLELYGYFPSGWDGSWGPYILTQLEQFGIVTTDTQKTKGCSGVKSYPTMDPWSKGTRMSATDYRSVSSSIERYVTWDPIMTTNQRASWSDSQMANKTESMLNAVKRELAVTSKTTPLRVTFGTLVPVSYCSVGACGSYHAAYDTWVVTDEIAKDKHPRFGGHEMVIIGYDDNAVVKDNDGKAHKGLLILRNSWGESAGDKGNYYMSYEFFKKYALEVQRVMKPIL